MANANHPRGFWARRPIKPGGGRIVTCTVKTAESIKAGDPVKLVDLKVQKATAADRFIYGVAAEDTVSASPATIQVYLAKDWIFGCQCSGTYAAASHDFKYVDIETTAGSGDFEINENAVLVGTVQVLRLIGRPDNVAGANADVECVFACPQGDGDERLVYVTAGGLGANATFSRGIQSPLAGDIVDFDYCQDTATTGSDGSNKWVLTSTDGAGNDHGVAKDSSTAEFAANTAYNLASSLSTNLAVTKGELLKFTMTKTGTPTDLSAALCFGTWAIRPE